MRHTPQPAHASTSGYTQDVLLKGFTSASSEDSTSKVREGSRVEEPGWVLAFCPRQLSSLCCMSHTTYKGSSPGAPQRERLTMFPHPGFHPALGFPHAFAVTEGRTDFFQMVSQSNVGLTRMLVPRTWLVPRE